MNIFLAGDSLVQDYKEEEFIAGWGQYLRQMVDSSTQVFNEAVGGRSSRLFLNEGRLQRIADHIAPGDYLLIEFCHNDDDSKEYRTMFNRLVSLGVPDEGGRYPIIPGELADKRYLPQEYLDALNADASIPNKEAVIQSIYGMFDSYPGEQYYPYSADGSKGTYKWFLKQYVDCAREAGAIPVFVTAPARAVLDQNGKLQDGPALHGGHDFCYIRAMKQLAEEAMVPVLDLFEATRTLYEEVGANQLKYLTSIKVGNNKGIWPVDFDQELKKKETVSENTHLNKYGAYLVSMRLRELILSNMNKQIAPLKEHFVKEPEEPTKPEGFQYNR